MLKREQGTADPGRHGTRIAVLRRAVFDSPGATTAAVRAAAASGQGLPPPLAAYAAKVADAPYRIGDADLDALRADGCGESEIFEITVAAALGAALRSLDAGMRALSGGTEDAPGDS